jgi:hypothetical protein
MKNRRLARFVFGSLVALLPVFSSGGPWNPNRARPPGFQRTLAYLEGDLYDYPDATLQQARNKILHDDLMTVLIPQLKASYPPSTWEAESQKAHAVYSAQYEQMKTLVRQTMSDPEGLIQAIENNQPIPAELLPHPNTQALVLLKWQLLNLEEQTYQAVLYAQGAPPGGSPRPPTDIGPPKPAKPKPGVDLNRMRETWRRAVERRRAFEEQAAREAAKRQAELNELIKRLLDLPQSQNKFQSRPAGGYLTPAAEPTEPGASEPASSGEPKPTIEEIEKIEEQITDGEQQQKAEESPAKEKEKPLEKITVYRGTLILRRPPNLSDATDWKVYKDAVIKTLAEPPGATDLNDKGDEVSWRYKLLKPGGYPVKLPYVQDIPDAETTEEIAATGSKPAGTKTSRPKPAFQSNGDADPEGLKGKDLEGSGPRFDPVPNKFAAKPKPEPAQAKSDKPAAVPGYWYDPDDVEAKGSNPIIYVRVEGVATRVYLNDASDYGVPKDATLDTMTWYRERTGKIDPKKNRGTQNGKP